MRSIRTAAALAAAGLALVVAATPAWAHEEINPKTIPTGAPTFLTLTVANEAKADLTKVVLTAPKGLPFGEAVRSPSGWTAQTSGSTITWSGGKVAPANFEVFGFETDGADQPGTLNFTVALTAGGATDNVTVPVTVTTGSTTTTAAGTATSGATTTISPSSSTTAATTPAPVPASVTDSVDSAKNRSAVALVLGIIAVVLAILAILLAVTRNRPGTAHAPAAPQDF